MAFVLAGQYLIWGRFFYAAWKKRRNWHAVTDRRVSAVQWMPSRKIASAYIAALPGLDKTVRCDGRGTLRFSAIEAVWAKRRGWWPICGRKLEA